MNARAMLLNRYAMDEGYPTITFERWLIEEIERLRAGLEGAATAFTEQGEVHLSNVMIALRDGVAPPMVSVQDFVRRFGPQAMGLSAPGREGRADG